MKKRTARCILRVIYSLLGFTLLYMLFKQNDQVTDAVPSSKEYYQMLQSVRCPSLRDDQLQEPYYLCTSSPPPGLNASYLVTLFTTVPEDTSKLDVFINSINVWSALGSSVRRVLFVAPLKQEDSKNTVTSPQAEVISRACAMNWDVLLAPRCVRDNHPVLTGMFTMAERLWTSEWYAFANADILFDMSLIDTLNFLSKAPTTQPLALLIGETTDVKMPGWKQTYVEETKHLKRYATKESNLDLQYFISRKGQVAWKSLPPFAVGKGPYGSWLVWHSLLHNVPVVDITSTCETYHQSHQLSTETPSVVPGSRGTGNDAEYNVWHKAYNQMYFGRFNGTGGSIKCASFRTAKNKNQRILQKKMRFSPAQCSEKDSEYTDVFMEIV